MRVLVDTTKKEVPAVCGTEIVQVNSEELPTMPFEHERPEVLRAEYLYKECVDGGIKQAAVEDVLVAEELKSLGIDTVHII